MKYIPIIVAALLTFAPVSDTGTGTATEYEYEVPYVTEVTEETDEVEETEETEDTGDTTPQSLRDSSPDKGSLTPHPSAAPTPFPQGEGFTGETGRASPSPTAEEETDAPLPEDMDERGYLQYVSMREIEMLAYLVDGEIGGGTYYEKCAVVWCVLNRVDRGSAAGFKDTVYGVLTQTNQFRTYYGTGSGSSTDVVIDCLTLWTAEKNCGYPIAGRVLPRDYCWYSGDGRHNHFRNAYRAPYTIWDWSWTGGY